MNIRHSAYLPIGGLRTALLALALGSVMGTVIAAAAPSARAADLVGSVTDAHTGLALANVRVLAVEAGVETLTSADGSFVLDVAADTDHTLVALPEGMDPADALYRVRQRSDRPAHLRVFDPSSEPNEGMTWGAPLVHRPLPDDPLPEGPVSLEDFLPGGPIGPIALSFPGALPESIRVGRRFASSCSGNPVQRIDTVPLEEYVEGVLVPEIGVFRSVEGGPDSAAEVFKAFAVAARSYAVWFYLSHPDDEYHIDDTACNQRYEDDRNEWIAAQVAVTRSQLLVRASDHGVLDKYEYAASCGRHGSRPIYQDELVPDVTGRVGCVGSWCGHNNCAAHEVNPAFPDLGRCLVRGICQWGGVERSMNGEPYLSILEHYQPNLDVITVGAEVPPTRLLGYVRVGDVLSGPPVAGVVVTLDLADTASTDTDGLFAFEGVAPGDHVLDYAGGGIVPISRSKVVEEGITNWASIAVTLEGGVEPDVGTADAGSADAGTDIAIDAVADSGTGPDIGRVDTGAPFDTGVPVDTGMPDSEGQDVTLADALPNDGSSSAPVPLFSIASEDTRIERGCASHSRRFGPWGLAAVALMFGLRRRR